MAEQHNEIVNWLENYLSSNIVDGNEWKLAKTFEETPDISSKLKSKEERFSIDKYAIDIICYREESEVKEDSSESDDKVWHYTFYIVSVNSFWNENDEIDESLRNKLLFYQFYFSQRVITEPKAIRITVVIPSSLILPKQIKINNKNAKDFFEEYGFGLWKVDIQLDKPEEMHKSFSLRGKMIKDFVNAIDDDERLKPKMEEIALAITTDATSLKEQIKLKAEEFALFFDQYVLDAIDAIAGIKKEQIGKRYIDRRLLDLTCKCTQKEKIPYHNELRDLLNEHLDKKEDEYDFTKKCFGKLWELLWGKYSPSIKIKDYPLILQEFEPLLQQFSKRYREHFVHQFQVFLLGTIIFDKVCDSCFSDLNKDEVEKIMQNWLLASSIHDLTYPLQEYDKWSSDFFVKQLNINEPLSFLELSNIYVEKRFANRVEYIISQLKDSWSISSGQVNKVFNAIRNFIYYEIANKKNHGLMSASYLLKTLEYQDQDIINIFLPAATAMALHDDEIWQVLSNQINNYQPYLLDKILNPREKGNLIDIIENKELDENTKDDKIARDLYEKEGSWKSTLYRELVDIVKTNPLPHLCFEKQPIAFLLILCDNLQDSGRPCQNEEFNEMMELTNIRLKDVVFQPEIKELKIQMSFVNTPACSKFMANKKETLEKMGNFLYSEKNKFIIEFLDSTTGSIWFDIKISNELKS
jgi:hypothetical protein